MGKDTKIFVELVVVIGLVGFGLWSLKQNPISVVDISPEVNSVENAGSSNSNVKTNVKAPTAATMSYANALAQYKDARIQLDEECRATPTYATFKNNASIMIDNRSAVPRTVRLGSVFNMKAWDFKIVKLSSTTLPATWYMDCGTSQNVASILIQK